jgi:lipoprotein-anchoring transpeptidase ErfK/SrfK
VANQINISPKNKKVVIANGTSTVEREGSDGLAINQGPAIDAITTALQEERDVSFGITASPVAFKTETFQIGGTGGLNYSQYIEISISRQRLWAWQDGQVVFTTAITTGAAGDGFPTLTGLFSVYAKERSRYLNGSQYGWSYNVYVDYWMPFNGGQGLHDADWRSSFGGQDYYYGGSHGCVNMPKSSAAFLFGWSSVGTPVWVHT